MSVSTPWTSATPASSARKNKTSVISDTGTNLAGYDRTKFAIVVCVEDGDIFIKDHVYLFGVDEDAIDISSIVKHNHTSDDDGGYFYNVMFNNPEVLNMLLPGDRELVKANWNQTTTGTATIEDGGGGSSDPYIRLRTNGTSGSGATISYTLGKPKINFASPFEFISVINFETASSLAAHIGVNADDVTAADSNTVKIQAEVCTATNSNWWLRTANGSANSASDIGVAISTSTIHVVLLHDAYAGTPNDQINVGGSTDAFIKTTNVATATSTTTDKFMKFSVKNSTTADRPMRVRGARMIWVTEDTWGYNGFVEPQP